VIAFKHSSLSKGYRKENNMSVSLREVIESGGYDITTLEDAKWLVSKQSEFNTLVEEAELVIETDDEN
jgi:uncharacterized protein (UPF0332 family)